MEPSTSPRSHLYTNMGSLRSQLQAQNWQVIVESLGGLSLKSPSSAASSLCILGDRRAYILSHHRCAGSGRKTGCEACESYSGVSPSLLETVGWGPPPPPCSPSDLLVRNPKSLLKTNLCLGVVQNLRITI